MNNTASNRFPFRTLDELRSEITRLQLDIPTVEDTSLLGKSLAIGGRKAPNRLCVQPMEGQDARTDGSPGDLTFRRYTQYAGGGFGLVWVEATAVLPEARSNRAQLHLHKRNVSEYAALVKSMRQAAAHKGRADPVLILQLTHAGRHSKSDGTPAPMITRHNPYLDAALDLPDEYPVVTDAYLDRLQDAYVECALLAYEAGFDGVDVKSCHGNLVSDLLAAFTRAGKYGGDFEGRTRFLRATVRRIAATVPALIVSTRMSAYDAVTYPYGFGVDKNDPRNPDLNEPIALIRRLHDSGLSLANISTGMPLVRNPTGMRVGPGLTPADSMENPLDLIAMTMGITAAIQQSLPALPVVGGCYSWFRQWLPFVAAGAVGSGSAAIAGLGRSALACPDAAEAILERGSMDPSKCCITCSSCIQLLRDGGKTGCVLKEPEVYGHEYRACRRFAPDVLKQEAERCHECEHAPCTAACPTGIDVPGFITAFAANDIPKAYETLRRSNVLPEMCAHLCPAWMMCEGACIEQTLTGIPVPIRDIQYTVCRHARDTGLTGIRMPGTRSGRNVAVIGGGPAGISGAVALLERGHDITIIEKGNGLGGMPESIIPGSRYAGAREEIETRLAPVLESGSLTVETDRALGVDLTLDELRRRHDAVLLSVGLWQEISLGRAEGVIDALTFLKQVKNGALRSMPGRVAILGGGDSAMDAALAARELGAGNLYLVFGGSFSDLHWHMSEGWFRRNNIHCLMLTDPTGYEVDNTGTLTGIEIRRTDYGPPDASDRRIPEPVAGTESILPVDMAIEAMGLRMPAMIKDALKGIHFTETGLVGPVGGNSFATNLAGVYAAGAIVNGGATVCQCIAEGMKAASEIDHFLQHG